jgi:hypothetical protein
VTQAAGLVPHQHRLGAAQVLNDERAYVAADSVVVLHRPARRPGSGPPGRGAGAVGALAVGRLAIGRAVIRRLQIEDLEVKRLHVQELRVDQQSTTAEPRP